MKILKRISLALLGVGTVALSLSAVPVQWLPWYPSLSEPEAQNEFATVNIPLENSPYYLPVVMAQERRLANTTLSGTLNYCADAGANDSYACSMTPALPAYTTGACYVFKANTANTGAATIALNGLSAITIKKVAGGITTDLADNDIRSGQLAFVCYDGTNMQLQSILGNAPSGSDSGFAFVGGGQEPLGAGITAYRGTVQHSFQAASYVSWSAPANCTARNLRVRTVTAQPGDNTMVVTLYNSTTLATTALTLTIAAGAAAGLFSNTSDTVSITAGDSLALQFVNNSSSSSAALHSWSIQCN